MSGYTVNGVDVSLWQGAMDWNKASSLIQFAYAKMGQGNDALDPQWERNRVELLHLGIPFGGYWFVKPDRDWRKHADSIVAHLAGELPVALDIEDDGGLSKADLDNWLQKLVSELDERLLIKPMIYTRATWWNSHVPRNDWAKMHLLWIAHYTTLPDPAIPDDWGAIDPPDTWIFWQHSADGNHLGHTYGAESDSIDLDRFHWTANDFMALFGVEVNAPPDEPPPPPPSGEHVRTTTAVNIRTGPTINNNKPPTGTLIGSVNRGTVFETAGEKQGDWWPVVAWVHGNYVTNLYTRVGST